MRHLDLVPTLSHRLSAHHPGEDMFGIGVAAKNCNTTVYTQSDEEIRRSEKYIIHFETGISPGRIYFVNQVHGDEIVKIDAPLRTRDLSAATGDAMITKTPGSCLVIRTADCVPVMLYDSIHKCIAAVHSGWRSTAKNITGKTVRTMIRDYNCSTESLYAVILPGIRSESYQVSRDVAMLFPDHYSIRNESYYLSLQSAITQSLLDESIQKDHIFISFYDTYAHNDLFFSYRRNESGRNLNFIYM
ncbi:MAG: peptidoglycan editing factor PgeF [Spirochaetota bacterium]